MTKEQQFQYFAWGLLALLLAIQWAWCQYIAFPISFEKNLKRGKPWVYIPIRWRGAYKTQIKFISKIIVLALVTAGLLVIDAYANKHRGFLYGVYAIGLGIVFMRLEILLLNIRYQQQEDMYYYLHDELRHKLANEGKDIGESAFKSLAAYQYQNFLRKADEQGQLIKTLTAEAKISRKKRKESPIPEPVEM